MKNRSSALRFNSLSGTLLLSLVLFTSLAGVVFSPYDAVEADFLGRLAAPSPEHVFGTDEYGRDVFTRVAAGTFISLRVAIAAVTFAICSGVFTGAVTGYFGGWTDKFVMVVVDSLMAFPGLLLVMGIMAAIGPDETGVILALGIAYTPVIARVVRGTVLSLKEREFVQSSLLVGNGNFLTLLRHILPNCISPVVVIATTVFTAAILSETALSFLGLGVPPPAPSWGSMLADSRNFLGLNPWMGIFPGLAIVTTVLAINLIGDGLRDRFDPRMRGET